MKIKKIVSDGQLRPYGYRAAYVNYASFSCTCYPIGLHLIFRLFRRVWEWSCIYNPSKYEKALRGAYLEGRESVLKALISRLKRND